MISKSLVFRRLLCRGWTGLDTQVAEQGGHAGSEMFAVLWEPGGEVLRATRPPPTHSPAARALASDGTRPRGRFVSEPSSGSSARRARSAFRLSPGSC